MPPCGLLPPAHETAVSHAGPRRRRACPRAASSNCCAKRGITSPVRRRTTRRSVCSRVEHATTCSSPTSGCDAFNGLHLVMQVVRRPSRDGGHHHHRLRRAADGARGQPVSRGTGAEADQGRPSFLKTWRTALAGVRRQRRWPRKRVVGGFRVTIGGPPGRGRGRLLRRPPARAARPARPAGRVRRRGRGHRPAPRGRARVVLPSRRRPAALSSAARRSPPTHASRAHLARDRRSPDRLRPFRAPGRRQLPATSSRIRNRLSRVCPIHSELPTRRRLCVR